MLFGLLRNREIEEFGKALAERFAKRCPPEMQDAPEGAWEQKRQSAMGVVYSDVAALQRRTHVGWVRRAIMANTVKWELKERGYRNDLVNSIVLDMLVQMTRR